MKKILMFILVVVTLSTCASVEEKDTAERMSRDVDNIWWQETGEPNGQGWWGSEDEEWE